MQVLNWMGENFFLSVIMIVLISETVARIFVAGRRKAMKCKNCGEQVG